MTNGNLLLAYPIGMRPITCCNLSCPRGKCSSGGDRKKTDMDIIESMYVEEPREFISFGVIIMEAIRHGSGN